jgi:hypothetical protein
MPENSLSMLLAPAHPRAKVTPCTIQIQSGLSGFAVNRAGKQPPNPANQKWRQGKQDCHGDQRQP